MATHTSPKLTEEEYLALDLANEFRSEIVDSEMLAMSGGTSRHSFLKVKLTGQFSLRLGGRELLGF